MSKYEKESSAYYSTARIWDDGIIDPAQTRDVSYGRVPAGSVVISGSLPKDGGRYSLYAAIIVKRVDAQTRAKTSLNDLLRD